MINSVRNTVLSILNKNNYGYISPSDFNLYAKQAQLQIFEDYFSEYNQIINKENSRMSGTDYANKRKALEEAMEYFAVTDFLAAEPANGRFNLPSLIFNGNDYFMINKILYYPVVLASGSNTSIQGFALVDSSANFVLSGVQVGDFVGASGANQTATVDFVTPTTLSLSDDIFQQIDSYTVFSSRVVREAEKVSHGKITMLNNSILTAPTVNFPAYSQENDTVTIFPASLPIAGQVRANYFRYPFDPKWTFVTLQNGEPSFDQSQPDYRDFELPIEDEIRLIVKILQYCGISIREGEVYQFAKAEEQQDKAQ